MSSHVVVTADVYLALSSYALATEKEEVLAMLMGDVDASSDSVLVSHCLFCPRKDKRRDRVEISGEQLSQAISHAESTGTSVVGWAHSHPHITILPSHVDLRCQRDQQMLSDAFIGLIISVFNDFRGIQRTQFIAFRTVADGSELTRVEVPVYIRPREGIKKEVLAQLMRIPEIFLSEEKDFFTKAISSSLPSGSSTATNNAKQEQNFELLRSKLVTSHYSGLYIRNLSSILDKLCVPLVTSTVDRHQRNLAEIKQLQLLLAEP